MQQQSAGIGYTMHRSPLPTEQVAALMFNISVSLAEYTPEQIAAIVKDFQDSNPYYKTAIENGEVVIITTDDIHVEYIPELTPGQVLHVSLNTDVMTHEQAVTFAEDTKATLMAVFPNNNILVTSSLHNIEIAEFVTN